MFYTALPVWIEYCSFAIGLGDPARCRSIMSLAIDAVGYHVTDGKLIWDLVIEYEQALLSVMQAPPGACTTAEQQEEITAQTEKVGGLYERLIATPLVGE